MTREQQERVAREILGVKPQQMPHDSQAWTIQCGGSVVWYGENLPDPTSPLWLWPLRIALEERGWEITYEPSVNGGWWTAYRDRDEEYVENITPAEAVNAAALVELEGKG